MEASPGPGLSTGKSPGRARGNADQTAEGAGGPRGATRRPWTSRDHLARAASLTGPPTRPSDAPRHANISPDGTPATSWANPREATGSRTGAGQRCPDSTPTARGARARASCPQQAPHQLATGSSSVLRSAHVHLSAGALAAPVSAPADRTSPFLILSSPPCDRFLPWARGTAKIKIRLEKLNFKILIGRNGPEEPLSAQVLVRR